MTISGIIRYSVLALLLQCLSANASYHTADRLNQTYNPNRSISHYLDGYAYRLTQILEPNRNIDYTLDGNANRITETIIKGGREAIRGPNQPNSFIILGGCEFNAPAQFQFPTGTIGGRLVNDTLQGATDIR